MWRILEGNCAGFSDAEVLEVNWTSGMSCLVVLGGVPARSVNNHQEKL